jgi:diguanylate cyclase (GGDEF)-like protein
MTENIDYLTQLKTRKYLFDKYNDFIENNNHAKAIMLDFRKLKDINDNFGHLVGDELLVAFSNLMKKHFDGDVLIRMGGDEFLVLTSDSQKSIDQKLKAVRNGMMDIYDSKSINQSIPFNAGITPCLDDISRTLFQADLAMYSAKGEDKLYKEFDFVLYRKYDDEVKFVKSIDETIFKNSFKFTVRTIESNEKRIQDITLIDDEGKKIYSSENYKLLIKNNLFNKIDFSVLDSYLSSIKDSHDEYMINIYHDTLLYRDKDYVSYLKKHIDKFKIAHDRICINVNTAHYDGKAEILISRLNELKELGVKVSIGNINLDSQQYILPIMALCNIDYIKVDRDILEGTMEENRVLKLVKSIVQMSSDLDIKTIFINVSEKEIKHVYKLDNNPLIRKIKDLD